MDIKSMTLDELKDACQQMGEKPFRAKQLYDWMHHRLAGSYDEMTNLSHLPGKIKGTVIRLPVSKKCRCRSPKSTERENTCSALATAT